MPQPSTESSDGRPSSLTRAPAALARGVTARAIVLSLILLVVLAPISFYVEQVVKVSWGFSEMVPPIAALGLAFVITAANQLAARRGRGLNRRELLLVYIVLTIGAPMVSRGIMLWFLSCSLGQQYLSQTMPQWEPAFFRYIPAWFYPNSWSALEGFFEGDASVPWRVWAAPLAAWGSFLVAFLAANMCLQLLLRRQWVNSERLSFPVAQVPLEAVREDADGRGRLPAAPAFWIGFAGVLLLYAPYRLSAIFPAVPNIPLGEYRLIAADKTGPLVGVGDIWLILYPWCIALAYLIPKELSFSVWFFWLIRVACTVGAIAAGATPRKPEEWGDTTFPAPYYQGGGAVIALGLLALWGARRQIAHAIRAALRGRQDQEDLLAYRWILLGLVLSVGYLVMFCRAAGMRPVVGAGLVAMILCYHLIWARLRAENGMSFIGFPLATNEILTGIAGTAALRPAEVVTILATRWSYAPGWGESLESVTGSSLDALKISDSAGIRQKPLLLAMAGCLLFALTLGVTTELTGVYHYGFYNILPQEGWLESSIRNSGSEIYEAVTHPVGTNWGAVAGLSAGLVVTLLLGELRLRFWWWPLHPVGYLAANVWGSQWWYMPLFIGWALKSLAIRYGGLRLYQATIPMAIGVIIGDRVSEVVWALILWAARVHG